MKKSIIRIGTFLMLFALCASALLACGAIKFELSFKVDGKTYATLTTAGRESITLPENPTKEGYVFDGWYWDEGTWERPFTVNSLLDAPLSSDMSVHAHFVSQAEKEQEEQEDGTENNSYTVTFETNGGTALPSQKVEVLNESPVTEKDYNSFVGWYTDANLQESTRVTFPYTPTSDVTLYAKWTVNFTEGLQMTLQVSTNTYAVTGYTGVEEVVAIPSTYKGLEVTAINARAFEGNFTITKVVIPDSVTTVGLGAFSECYNLKTVEMSSQLQLLGANAFSNCIKLESITIPDSLQNIGGEAFFGCTALRELYLSNQLVNIGANIIRGCNALEKLTLPGRITLKSLVGDTDDNIPASLTEICVADGSEMICASMLLNCSQIETLTIPATVASIGENAFSGCTALASVRYGGEISDWCEIDFANAASTPNSYRLYIQDTELTSVTFSQNTGVKPYVFNGCIGLETVIISDGISAIGTGAFSVCTALTSITIPNSVTSIGDYAFDNCTGLTSITIPNGVTSIGTSAFSGCTGLISVTISASVTGIGDGAFDGCTAIRQATMPTVVIPSIQKNCLQTVVINGGTDIPASAFSGCTNVTSVTISDSVTNIGSSAFSGCTGLTSIIIPNSVTSIGDSAFSGCTSLVSLTIPFVGGSASATSASSSTLFGYIFGTSSYAGGKETEQYYSSSLYETYYIPTGLNEVTVTGGKLLYGAFYNCEGLTSVTIENSVTSIGEYAFYCCTRLASVTIPNSVTSIGEYAFLFCGNLTSITIPNSVTSIGISAFYWCTGLTSVTIPNSVTSIGYSAFSGCTGLTSVTFGNGVTSIGNYAFSDCTGLTSITIPNSVTNIGYRAFYGCTNLTSMTFVNIYGWYLASSSTATSGISISIGSGSTPATRLVSTYCDYYWKRNV